MKSKIVITGAGVTSALGNTRQELYQNLLDGKSAVIHRPDWIEKMVWDKPVVAATIDLPQERIKQISRHFRRSMGPAAMFSVLAAQSTVEESGFTKEQLEGGRIGCAVSSTLGSPTETWESAMAALNNSLYDLSACQFFKIVSHSSAFNVANYFGMHGVQLAPCSACASSLQSLGIAYEQLLLGKQDAFLAGGSDEVAPIVLESFRFLRALAEETDLPPEQMSRPFDARRRGLICGEGAGILALETLEHAQARGAKPLAEIIGYATNCTGSQISQSDSSSIVTCMKLALQDAGITPEQVDYISAHATGTVAGDKEEATAIREVFGDKVPVSSLKSQLGHTMGASGALETAVILEMMANSTILPNHNFDQPGEGCEGIFLPTSPLQKELNIVLKNCIAFGGVNCTMILKRINN